MHSPLRKSRSLPQKQYSSLILQSKIKQYRAKLHDSRKQFNESNLKSILTGRKSSHSRLPQVYNSPRRQQKNRPQTATQDTSAKKQILNYMIDSNELNPEKRFTLIDIKASILLTQLDGKAKEITSYSDQNAELLKKKKNLDERIAKLKEAIADETKKLSQAKTNCGILNNNIDETMRRFHQKNVQSNQLNKMILETTNDINRLKKKKMQNQAESDYNKKWIVKLMTQNDQLSLHCQNTNVMLLKEDDIRIDTKDKLIYNQKVMQNASITYKQLVSQKQHLQVHVDKAYYENKIAENAKGSRLPVNSAKK